ncbi:class I SAM-dependent methyltransferase [Embleya hyalina]|uniref:Methyltransferase type 11 n=1 Tax=Embleya hyalina TaxID=516124 RepID=A0A401Z6T2_9ACTN|nr:methyltransferase domain-containing protein [Embleya hyalina]GCE02549.1 methyltransferase type 11 [Embleya hyalina]
MTLAHAPTPGTNAPTDPYADAADPYAVALRDGGPLYLRRHGGRRQRLELARWCAEPDAADDTLLARCTGPTLDVGCGPGRLAAALTRRGVTALGVDPVPAAVARSRAAGASALCRSVFEPLPGEGRWAAALLADGNIGIGGDPARLLDRMHTLLAPGGLLLVETDPQDVHERFAARVENAGGGHGGAFRWARIGTPSLRRLAPAHAFTPTETWTHTNRTFAALRRH